MNPWLAGLPFAPTGGTYPVGPGFEWDGAPTTTPPAYTFFTPSPGFAPTAPALNGMFNQRDKAILYNAAAVGISALLEDEVLSADGGWGTPYFNGMWASAAYAAGGEVTLGGAAIATLPGDMIEVSFASSLQITCGLTASVIAASLAICYAEAGPGFVNFSGGEASRQKSFAATEEDISPVTLLSRRTVTTGGAFAVGINGCVPSGLANVGNWGLATAWSLRIRHLRPNP